MAAIALMIDDSTMCNIILYFNDTWQLRDINYLV